MLLIADLLFIQSHRSDFGLLFNFVVGLIFALSALAVIVGLILIIIGKWGDTSDVEELKALAGRK